MISNVSFENKVADKLFTYKSCIYIYIYNHVYIYIYIYIMIYPYIYIYNDI